MAGIVELVEIDRPTAADKRGREAETEWSREAAPRRETEPSREAGKAAGGGFE